MRINGWDIAEAGARQWNVSFASCDISTNSDWIEGSPIATLFRNNTSFKTLTITLMLNGPGREELLLQRSNILANLLEPSVIELDNYSHKFLGILDKINDPNEESMQRFHTLKFTFNCCEFGDCVTYTMEDTTGITVDNPGNIMTPLIVELEALEDIEDYVLRGICRKLSILGHGIEEERNIATIHPILASDDTAVMGALHRDSSEGLLDTADGLYLDVMVDGEPRRLMVKHSDYYVRTPILYDSSEWKNDMAVEIGSLKAGEKITLNGETGLFTDEDGTVPESLIIWELPTVMPGSNPIYQNNKKVNVTLRFYPRYM